LREAGVSEGDRVAAILPNMAEAIVSVLATASIGAVWSSCSPDFGAQGVLDRFGQCIAGSGCAHCGIDVIQPKAIPLEPAPPRVAARQAAGPQPTDRVTLTWTSIDFSLYVNP
jgi:acyl-CoA synthetase (AMP-forming)/AMP-acid ligase II